MVRRTIQGLVFGVLLFSAIAQAETVYDRVSRDLYPQERARFGTLDKKGVTFHLNDFAPRLVTKHGNLEYKGIRPSTPAVAAGTPVGTVTQNTPPQTPVVVQPDHGVQVAPGTAPGGTPSDSTGTPIVVNGQKAIAPADSTQNKAVAGADSVQNKAVAAVDSTQSKAVAAVDSTQLKAVGGVADQSTTAVVSAAVAATVTEDEVHQYHQNAVWFFGAARSVKNSNDITACVLRLKTDIRPKLSAADQRQLDPRVSFFLDHRTQPTTFRGKRAAFGADACEIYEKKILKAMGLVK